MQKVPKKSCSRDSQQDYALILSLDIKRLFFELNPTEIGAQGRFESESADGRDFFMPARIGPYSALKYIRSRPGNTPMGLARSQSDVFVTESTTGCPLFQFPGKDLTPTKTALVNMVVLDIWRQRERIDHISLGIIGGGPVARKTILAAHELFGDSIQSTRVFSPRKTGKNLAAELGASHSVKCAPKEELLGQSNVIISATTSKDPVVSLSDIGGSPSLSRLLVGVGFYDVSPTIFEAADQIISEDPQSYARSAYPLGEWLRPAEGVYRQGGPELTSLYQTLGDHEHFDGQPLGQNLTLFMPYGTAMADAVLCLAAMGYSVGAQKQSAFH